MNTIKVRDPFDEGLDASTEQLGEEMNPYGRGTDAYQLWKEGYQFGEDLWRDTCDREVAAGRPHPDA